MMENNSFDQVDIQALYKQACTIIENNKELWGKIAQELYNKKILYPNDINRILLNNKELVDKLRSYFLTVSKLSNCFIYLDNLIFFNNIKTNF
ncbi:hypothetical protein [Maize bushy stunt phytoplasma]|nr:hypothetical protein [Maize bushy stunt phytoplasma]